MSIINDYLTESITITPKGTLQKDGTYAYDGTAVSTSARVTDKVVRVRTETGDEIIFDRVFWLSPSESLATGDRITWNSTNHEVMEIREGRFLVGGESNHLKVLVRVK